MNFVTTSILKILGDRWKKRLFEDVSRLRWVAVGSQQSGQSKLRGSALILFRDLILRCFQKPDAFSALQDHSRDFWDDLTMNNVIYIRPWTCRVYRADEVVILSFRTNCCYIPEYSRIFQIISVGQGQTGHRSCSVCGVSQHRFQWRPWTAVAHAEDFDIISDWQVFAVRSRSSGYRVYAVQGLSPSPARLPSSQTTSSTARLLQLGCDRKISLLQEESSLKHCTLQTLSFLAFKNKSTDCILWVSIPCFLNLFNIF